MAIAGAVLIVAVFLVLHAERWLILSWQRAPLAKITAEEGYAYVAPSPINPEPTDCHSPARLYEDGRRLGPGNSAHDDIRHGGGGRFSAWGSTIYLSSWDGTDPRVNGRRYEIAVPRAVSPALAWSLLLLATAGTTVAAARLRGRSALRVLADHAPLLGTGLILLGFAIPRLSFVVHYPLPDIAVDFHSYFQVTEQMRRGEWPDFSVRTPGYPIFLTVVFALCDRLMAVIVAQNIISLGCALAAFYCFVRADRRLALPAAVGLFAFLSSADSGWFDVALMSESLYSSLLVLSVGLLTLGVVKDGAGPLAGASLAMAAALFTRPAGMFFLVIYVMVVGYLLLEWQRGLRPRRSLLAFAAPFAAILLSLCVYNRARIGVFTPSPFGEMNMVGAVATYAEEDPSLPAELNEAIRDMRAGVSPADRQLIETSWDVRMLFGAFARNFDSAIYIHLLKVKGNYLENRLAYRNMERIAISRHPDRYLEFVAAGLYNFYVVLPGHPAEPVRTVRAGHALLSGLRAKRIPEAARGRGQPRRAQRVLAADAPGPHPGSGAQGGGGSDLDAHRARTLERPPPYCLRQPALDDSGRCSCSSRRSGAWRRPACATEARSQCSSSRAAFSVPGWWSRSSSWV